MAKVSLNNLKNWFKTGLIPTQQQFWDMFDSFFHKDDVIPINKIAGIQNIYDTINNHIQNENAHAGQFANAKLYKYGEFQIFKNQGNYNVGLEVNDVCVGFLNDGTFIPFGKYLGGEVQDIANWDTSPMWAPE
jgi:hypothetical protein